MGKSEVVLDLSIVIACYNEEPVLRQSVKEIIDILGVTRYHNSYELIFVDDKSRDRTVEIIKELMALYPSVPTQLLKHPKNTGRGQTVTDGLRLARGRIAGFLDIDLETPARYIPAAALEIERGAEVVSAFRVYRFLWRTFYRQILSVGYHALEAKALRLPLKDTEVGFKFFNRERILPILAECEDPGWFWDTEIMARSYFGGLKIVEIPTLFIKRYDKQSSVKIIPDTLAYFKNLLRFRREAHKLEESFRVKGITSPVKPDLPGENKEELSNSLSLASLEKH